ncbi:MAG: flagellar motor switch phosphatase FliY [Peptococcaceae bacterium]|nr:flagellar motor switch phosphatase FliY [Peptococcaceae bacterium]
MSSGSLSQEEINALLASDSSGSDDTKDPQGSAAGSGKDREKPSKKGSQKAQGQGEAAKGGGGSEEPSPSEQTGESKGGRELTDVEKDALGEIANISMGTAATTLSQLLGKKVEITTPKVDLATIKEIVESYPVPHVLIDVEYKRELGGSNMLILSRTDGSIIVDLMMGGTGMNPTDQLNDIQISGISEAMNQMMGSAATSMSTVFDSVVDISTPVVHVGDSIESDIEFINTHLNYGETVIRVSFRMVVEGIIDSVLLQLIPFDNADKMMEKLFEKKGEPQALSSAQGSGQTPAPGPSQLPPQASPQVSPQAVSQPAAYGSPPPQTQPSSPAAAMPTMVQSAEFAQLTPGTMPIIPNNLDLIYDVPLQVSVELGRTRKTIREILDLGSGSVVELDRLAGESVDMAVNGKLIAKCEVVVVNEMFGIKITEIVTPNERFQAFS